MFHSLSGNFLQVPLNFIDALVQNNVTRDELLVCLHLARGTFGLHGKTPIASLDQIALAIDLEPSAVQEALARAVDRGIILKFDVVDSPDVSAMYSLHTEENHLLAYYERVDPTTAPIAVPTPEAQASPAQAADQPPRPAVEAPEHTTITRPIPQSLLTRVVGLVGRTLTKDEKARLDALGAADNDVIEAIEKLQARKVQIYSSDQIIYEYEAMQHQRKQAGGVDPRFMPKKPTSICSLCGGTGYIFIGKSSLRVCDCRGTR